MALLLVNGIAVPDPSEMKWGKQDVSIPDSGRTLDGRMHKGKVAEKIKIELKWPSTTPDVVHEILSAFNHEYFNVTYFDPLAGDTVTKEFYTGDMSAPVRWWCERDNSGRVQKWYTEVAFNIIEV